MSITCPRCGTPNSGSYRFCSNCGTLLNAAPVSAPADQVATSTPSPDVDEPVTYTVQRWDSASSSDAPTLPVSLQSGPAVSDDVVSRPYIPPVPPTPVSTFQPPPPLGYKPAEDGPNRSAAYVPYSDAAVAHVESPKQARSWLIPVIVASLLVLAALAGTSYYLMQNNPTTTAGTTQGSTQSGGQQSKLPANASEEDRVKEAIRLSNDGQIQAWRTLDTEVLKATRTGKVLQQDTAMVQELKQKNMYAIPVMERLDILDVKVTGDTAIARTIERWTVTFYNKGDGKQVQSQGPDTYTETYYLVKKNGAWLVSDLVINNDNSTPTVH